MISVRKFSVAFQGIAKAVRDDASFRVHGMMGIAVMTIAGFLRCDAWEWCVVLLCIGMVWTAELINTAIEILFKGFPVEVRYERFPCLDIAAGAVLFCSIMAAIVGCVIFVPRIIELI